MSRARVLVALALAAALAACGGAKVSPQGVQLRRPSSVAAFHGVVFGLDGVRTYLAVANEGRDDISILKAGDDSPMLAPVSLKTLVVPVSRPAILVAAPLGDDKADLLVAVSAGDSKLQLVRTWNANNEIVDEPIPVDFGYDVIDAVPFPAAAAKSARIAVALAGGRIGIATYVRVSGDAIANEGFTISDQLAFQPMALAALPGDPTVPGDPPHVYAATPDVLDEAAVPPVFGVADIQEIGTPPKPTYIEALDARGPTRLVAAASLRERPAGSTATKSTAFDGQPTVRRVYAVLDESGCGTAHRIDCGVAVLNPAADTVAVPPRAPGLLPDVSGRMPYLAPIPLPSVPVAIAVSPPPVLPPSADYAGDVMRLWPAIGQVAATSVAAVPCENGRIYFLDLSRWKVANDLNPLASIGAVAASTSVDVSSAAGVTLGSIRLWVADTTTGNPLPETATADQVRAQIGVTPGYTRSETFTVGYQADLPSLTARRAEVESDGTNLWLAMIGPGEQPVRLWDPALGVRADDIVAIYVAGLPAGTGCVGTEPPGAVAGTAKIFETRVAELLAPTDAHPGGRVRLKAELEEPVPTPTDAPDPGVAVASWGTCFQGLVTAASGKVLTGLTASIRASRYVVSSNLLGHLKRIDPASETLGFTLDYPSPGEDSLSCPLVPWPNTVAEAACGVPCGACEALLLARKSRRSYHVAESCPDAACTQRWAGKDWLTSPDVAGPVVDFRFALQPTGGVPVVARRGLSLRVTTAGGVSPFAAGNATGQGTLVQPNGATAFDRSKLDKPKGYRFFVPYAGNFVIDTSPSIAGGDPVSIH